jgi:hypothetical protein
VGFVTPSGYTLGVFDDVIITDDDGTAMTTPLAECMLTPLRPSGDVGGGTLTASTSPGVTTKWTCIDEDPASTSDYAYATAAGQGDYYDLDDPTSTPSSVHFLSVTAEATRSGTIANARMQIDSGGTTAESADLPLPASPSYAIVQNVWLTDPHTTSAWDSDGVNALKAGIKFT